MKTMIKNKSSTLFIYLGISFWLLAVIIMIFPSWPHIYYRLSPNTSEVLASTIASTVSLPPTKPSDTVPSPTSTPTPTPPTLPPLDPSLPKENGLIIESIGVRGQIHQGENWQEILRQGIWRVPNFGTPEDNLPIILAAHRWGYLSWSNQFRRLNSFYNLPQLKNNDKVTIIWNQRQYQYQIYDSQESEKISDYTADLILYTCKLWESPIRTIKYAKRVN